MQDYRAIWLSDIHLGTKACQAKLLLDFLKNNNSQKLFLVGDIIDGWALKKKWYWPQYHNDVIQKILRKSRKGTKVYYIPGNHDAMARQFFNMNFSDIKIVKDAYHTTKLGRKLWIVHGDIFDSFRSISKLLHLIGDGFYSFILWINEKINIIRSKYGLNYWSLSQHIKSKISNVNEYIENYQHFMVREAKIKGCDGVVCGHIHRADIKEIDGVLYLNDGDWVESLTALVETKKGELKIIHWPKDKK